MILPPWLQTQLQQLLRQRGHAWLLTGPSGLGQYTLALALVRAWLCEAPTAAGACGHCASCHGIDVHTHPDLCLLLPEVTALELGWPLDEKSQADIDAKKRKPSKDIRVEAMRDAVEFSQRTNARGRGKAVLVFPAERMNVYAANALLKTLEEPPGDVKFVLATQAEQALLPTLRSRCLRHTMAWPATAEAQHWLQQQGVSAAQSGLALRAVGGRPDDALQMAHLGPLWPRIPKAVLQGDVSVFKDWPAAQVVDVLQKLCHDVMTVQAGAEPRFFESLDLPRTMSWSALSTWAKALSASRRTVEHPFNPGLLVEALVSQAQTALNSRA